MKKSLLFFAFIAAISCSEDASLSTESLPSKVSQATADKTSNLTTLALSSSDYYLFMRGQSSPSIRYTRSTDGVNWGGQVLLPSKSSTSPSAMYYGGKYYSVCKGSSTVNIFLSSSTDGVNWTQIQIPGASSWAPGICASGGQIYVFYNDDWNYKPTLNSQLVYTKSSDGVTWTTPIAVCNTNCYWSGNNATVGDVMAVSLNEIYTLGKLFDHDTQYALIKTDYNMSSIAVIKKFNDPYPCTKDLETDQGVSAANGLVAMKGKDTGYIFIIKPSSQSPGNCYTEKQLSVKTSHRPALIYQNGKYTLIFKGYSTAVLYSYESIDGVTWTNLRTIPSLETVAGPYFMKRY